MWFRAALLIILWLAIFRLIGRVLRALTGASRETPRARRERPEGWRSVAPDPEPPPWRPADVIDVSYRDADPEDHDDHETGARQAGR